MDVASFTIDHDRLSPGVYVSRKDPVGREVLTTFDIRMKVPNTEPVLGNPEIHTLEHLLAVYLRSPESGWADKVIYVGPMGCRTGIYLILTGDLSSEEILPLLKNTFRYVADFTGTVPATTSPECGNYLDHNLTFAKIEAEKYLKILNEITPEQLTYPE